MDHHQTGTCLQNVAIVNKHPHFLTLKAKILVERDGPIIKNACCSSIGSRLGPSTTCRLRTGWNWLEEEIWYPLLAIRIHTHRHVQANCLYTVPHPPPHTILGDHCFWLHGDLTCWPTSQSHKSKESSCLHSQPYLQTRVIFTTLPEALKKIQITGFLRQIKTAPERSDKPVHPSRQDHRGMVARYDDTWRASNSCLHHPHTTSPFLRGFLWAQLEESQKIHCNANYK